MAAVTAPDPVELAQRLIRCPSVTPTEGGALDVLEEVLGGLGFRCTRLTFTEPGTADVANLHARIGTGSPHIAFAGHTDVVPVGDAGAWSVDPFGGKIVGDELIGRGAVDMKGAIAAFVAAVGRFLEERGGDPGGSISFLITGDEEGPSINGTRKLLEWMQAEGEQPEMCVVGEPTSEAALGDTIKVGRRGSLTARLTVHGRQGHTAYPHKADNPVHHLTRALRRLIDEPIDDGSRHFEPSALQVTSVDVGNPAHNVIPAAATATLNVRFNDRHTSDHVLGWMRARVHAETAAFELAPHISGESFLSPPGPLTDALGAAVQAVLGRTPALGTGGGTSDARFIKDLCPVAELGLRNATAHQVDERTGVQELRELCAVDHAALQRLLAA